MAEENTPPSPGTGATPTPGTPATGTPAPGSATPPVASLTLEEALKRITDLENSQRNATEEVERHRKKLTVYEKREQEAEAAKRAADEAQLSEIERTRKQYADLQVQHEREIASYRERLVRYEVERAASKLSIVDPDAAAKLIDWSELEFDEDGTPKNADKLLTALAKAKPWLVQAQPAQQQQSGQAQSVPAGQQQQQQNAPTLPGMNPGRSHITPPSQLPAGKIPSIAEAFAMNKQQQRR